HRIVTRQRAQDGKTPTTPMSSPSFAGTVIDPDPNAWKFPTTAAATFPATPQPEENSYEDLLVRLMDCKSSRDPPMRPVKPVTTVSTTSKPSATVVPSAPLAPLHQTSNKKDRNHAVEPGSSKPTIFTSTRNSATPHPRQWLHQIQTPPLLSPSKSRQSGLSIF